MTLIRDYYCFILIALPNKWVVSVDFKDSIGSIFLTSLYNAFPSIFIHYSYVGKLNILYVLHFTSMRCLVYDLQCTNNTIEYMLTCFTTKFNVTLVQVIVLVRHFNHGMYRTSVFNLSLLVQMYK